ncbi:hypothetical protein C8J56DRAFT_1026304 [Mycena floridula]|nr:hypothetical protein C8J56DRAFT_1026304 [Mycena floridula]
MIGSLSANLIAQQTGREATRLSALRELPRLICCPVSLKNAVSEAGVEADLRQCQEEIDRQKNYTTALETKQRQLQRHHDAAKALTAPIRKLPAEILGHIFSDACDWNVIGDNHINLPGLRIAQVCSYWRNVVMSTKEAWSRIHWVTWFASDWSDFEDSARSMTRAVEFLLKQSCNQALDVELSFGYGDLDPVEQGWLSLVAQCDRWQSLSLDMSERGLLWVDGWLEAVEGKLPLLQKLTVSDTDYWEANEATSFAHLQFVPRLSFGSFDHVVFPALAELPPWTQQLRVLHLTNTIISSSPHPLSPLFSCTNIIEARISWTFYEPINNTALGQRNTVTTLRSLEFNSIEDISDITAFLSSLSLPNLTSFSLVGVCSRENKERLETFSLDSFLSQSQCNITRLSLKNLLLRQAEWISMLRALPALSHLSLELGNHSFTSGQELISDTFFNQMNEIPPLLPNIKHLSIQVPYPTISSTPERFLYSIQSRWMPDSLCDDIACLKFFSLVLPGMRMDTDTIRALERLSRTGMTVTVKDLTGYVVG